MWLASHNTSSAQSGQ